MKLFIIGHGRHGKDTVAEYIRDNYGLTFESSSMFCAEQVVRPWLENVHGLYYDCIQDCYDDRHEHRTAWYEAIMDFNRDDPARLSREIFAEHDMYVGIRSREEFLAGQHLADLSIWVDAFGRVETFDETCKIYSSDCDIVLDNNGTRVDHEQKLRRLFDMFILDTHK